MTDAPAERGAARLWDALRRRKVVQWGLVYVAGAWGFLQGLEYVSESFHWPEQFRQIALIALLIGLPIVLVLAWYHGDRGQQRITTPEFAILMLLLLAGGGAFWYYERTSETSTVAAPATPRATEFATDASIAVLPFVNMSPDKEQEYFADGISEELLNLLAQVPELRVIARTSSFYFKGQNLPIPDIALKLNVAYVVEGSVRRAGDRVKITAQLVKADGFHMWSDTFVRELKDVFAVQEEIAGLIARNLELELGSGAKAATTVSNPRVVELYLRAQQLIRLRTVSGYDDAERSLREAIRIEPTFARAHAALADTLSLRWDDENLIGRYGQRDSPKFAEIHHEITRALELEPRLAEAHAALGGVLLAEWKFGDAQAALRRAIEFNPNYATAHQWLARALGADGWIDEAIAELELAATLDPLSHRILDNLATALFLSGRTADALAVNERALAIAPNSDQALAFQAVYLDALGRQDEAIVAGRRAVAADPLRQSQLYGVFVRAGRRAEADAWPRRTAGDEFPALRYIHQGKMQQALAALDPQATWWAFAWQLLYSRDLDPIRSDQTFRRFIDELGLTDAYTRAQAWRAAHRRVDTAPRADRSSSETN